MITIETFQMKDGNIPYGTYKVNITVGGVFSNQIKERGEKSDMGRTSE